MADKYAQGGVTAEGTPTPTTIRAGEYVIHWQAPPSLVQWKHPRPSISRPPLH